MNKNMCKIQVFVESYALYSGKPNSIKVSKSEAILPKFVLFRVSYKIMYTDLRINLI